MPYTKHIWKNDELPAINDTHLNEIEEGIEEAHNNFANYKLKEDFAVITGTIECTNTQGHTGKRINYPPGFNKDNCVVIAVGLGGQSYNFEYAGLAYGYRYTRPQTGLLSGAQVRYIVFYEDDMSLVCYNPGNSAFTYTYKIVLLKIQEEENNE